MEPPADPIGLRLGRNLLAATARRAEGWYMASCTNCRSTSCARPVESTSHTLLSIRRRYEPLGRAKSWPRTQRIAWRPGSKHHILVDANGAPVSAMLTGANRNDATQLLPLVDAISPIRGVRGRPLQKPKIVYADRGYDSDRPRQRLRERGIKPMIAKRRTEHGSDLGKFR